MPGLAVPRSARLPCARFRAREGRRLSSAAAARLDDGGRGNEPRTVVRIEPSFTRSSFDENFWLSHCEGFRVECPSGYVGTVAHVRFGSRLDRPDQLNVSRGRLHVRSMLVDADEVAVIVPGEMRLRIRQGLPAAAGRRLGRVRRHAS